MPNFLSIRNIIRFIIIKSFLLFFSLSLNANGNVEIFTLSNGLEVVMIKTSNPTVTHAIAYNVGSMEEKSSQEGMAHLLEHLMFLGTNKYPREKLTKIIKESSAYYNAFTSFDITLYYMSYPKNYFSQMMEIEADRMKWLSFTEEVITNEKSVINEERNMRNNRTYNQFYELSTQYMFPTTNYGRSIIGYADVFQNISYQEIKDFYNYWYNPDNAKIFISGDIDFNETKAIVKRKFGKIKNTNLEYVRADYLENDYQSNVEVVYENNQIKQNIILKSFLVPSLASDTTLDKKESISLILLQELLSSKTGYLYRTMVLEKKILSDFQVDYNYSSKGHNQFLFFLIPNEEYSSEEALKEFDKALDYVIKNGFSEARKKTASRKIRDRKEIQKEDEQQVLFFIAQLASVGVNISTVINLERDFDKVRSSDINEVAKKYFSRNFVVAHGIGTEKKE